MPTNPHPLTFGTFYHIFNRGNNRENLFSSSEKLCLFHGTMAEAYFSNCRDFCILPFEKPLSFGGFCKIPGDLTGFRESPLDSGRDPRNRPDWTETGENLSGLKHPSQYFSNFFNAYTRGVNNATGRSGALFERPFERIPVTNEKYLMQLIVYIHQNPQKHMFVEDFWGWDFWGWDYSSYHDLIGNAPTRLQRDKVIELFGSREDFIRIH